MTKLLSLLAATLFTTLPLAAHAGGAPLPEIVIGTPNCTATDLANYRGIGQCNENVQRGGELDQLLMNPQSWSQLRRYNIGIVMGGEPKNVSDEDLSRRLRAVAALNMPIESYAGVIKEWSASGAESFAKARRGWDRILQDGGTINSVAMDDPLAGALKHQPPVSPQDAIEQIAVFVMLTHQYYPDIKVGLVNPYPKFSTEEAISQIDALQQNLQNKGVRGLDFYRVDPNWWPFVNGKQRGSWEGIKQIELHCHAIRLPFSLIYWASNYPAQSRRNGQFDDHFWRDGLEQEYQGYASTGIQPDQISIQSWVGAPSQGIPETNNLSFTGSALELLQNMGIKTLR